MTEKIGLALTKRQWGLRAVKSTGVEGEWLGLRIEGLGSADQRLEIDFGDKADGWFSREVPAAVVPSVIAIANAALPDSDPRKITREWVADERVAYVSAVRMARYAQDAGDEVERQKYIALAARHKFRADALESYLPPVDG